MCTPSATDVYWCLVWRLWKIMTVPELFCLRYSQSFTVNLPQIRIEFGFIGCNWSCFMKVFDLFLNDFVRCVHWRMRLHFMRRTNLSTSTCITNLYRVVEDTAQKEPCPNSHTHNQMSIWNSDQNYYL